MKDKGYTIRKIEKGIVIDHIVRGKALLIARLLGLEHLAEQCEDRIALALNCDSPTMGKKDIIKVENWTLTPRQLNYVALISPRATVSTISGYRVIEKRKVEIPDRIDDLVMCPDRFCITNHEEVPCKFDVIRKEPITLRCHYCETEFYGKLIQFK
jgi:aspartate carbamoyltransferase regulatory subunit